MAKTKQFTISIENRPGAVAEIARTLGSAKVNILALLGTAQGTTGTVELVVEDARRAKKALDGAGLRYKETTAEEYELSNKPGSVQGFLGSPCILDDEFHRASRPLRRSQESENIHLGAPQCASDLGNCTRAILNRNCELLGLGHVESSYGFRRELY